MEGGQNFGECQAPETVWLYRPGVTYPPNTGQQYPIQEGADLQQAHVVETDDMSMLGGSMEPQQVPPQSISGRDTAGPPFQQPRSDNDWTGGGVQSASGFSNDGMNFPGGGNIQMLPSAGSRNGDDVGIPFLQAPSVSNSLSGIGRQPASEFSNSDVNYPRREHLQNLPNNGSRSQPATGAGYGGGDTGTGGNNTELQERLKSQITDYYKKRKKCMQSFLAIGKDRSYAEANGRELKYCTYVDEMVKCHQCGAQAGISDKFHHRDDCVVLKVMKDIGYSSSDEDSLPQRSDSDASMESVEDGTNSTPSGENPSASGFHTAVPDELVSMTGFQTLNNDDSLFRTASGANLVLPTDDSSSETVYQLKMSLGYGDESILAVFKIQGPKCLKSVTDFMDWEERSKPSRQSNVSTAQCPSAFASADSNSASNFGALTSSAWSQSGYATAGDYTCAGATANIYPPSQGGSDVLLPPTFDFSSRAGLTLEVTGANDVSLDYRYCLGCKNKELACVNQTPCGHIVCKTCGDALNLRCKVCKKKVTSRGGFDFGTFGV